MQTGFDGRRGRCGRCADPSIGNKILSGVNWIFRAALDQQLVLLGVVPRKKSIQAIVIY
jgi:hypothetical protein